MLSLVCPLHKSLQYRDYVNTMGTLVVDDNGFLIHPIVDDRPCRCDVAGVFAGCRPYCIEKAGSHPNSAAKRCKARSVLGWGTAREHQGVDNFSIIFQATR